MLWLLASEYDDGQITAELDDIAWRFRMSLEDLHAAVRPLIAKGLFISDDPASAPLAPRKPDAMPEREEEGRERGRDRLSAGQSPTGARAFSLR